MSVYVTKKVFSNQDAFRLTEENENGVCTAVSYKYWTVGGRWTIVEFIARTEDIKDFPEFSGTLVTENGETRVASYWMVDTTEGMEDSGFADKYPTHKIGFSYFIFQTVFGAVLRYFLQLITLPSTFLIEGIGLVNCLLLGVFALDYFCSDLMVSWLGSWGYVPFPEWVSVAGSALVLLSALLHVKPWKTAFGKLQRRLTQRSRFYFHRGATYLSTRLSEPVNPWFDTFLPYSQSFGREEIVDDSTGIELTEVQDMDDEEDVDIVVENFVAGETKKSSKCDDIFYNPNAKMTERFSKEPEEQAVSEGSEPEETTLEPDDSSDNSEDVSNALSMGSEILIKDLGIQNAYLYLGVYEMATTLISEQKLVSDMDYELGQCLLQAIKSVQEGVSLPENYPLKPLLGTVNRDVAEYFVDMVFTLNSDFGMHNQESVQELKELGVMYFANEKRTSD